MIRRVRTDADRDALVLLIQTRKLPFVAEISDGRKRSAEQNRTQRMWINEVAEQLGDRTAEEIRGEAKLQFGVPILRAENEKFREIYDRLIKPLPYETKVAFMMEPIDFPVTRQMNVDQKTRFLDAFARFYAQQGVVLTYPEAA